MLRFVELRRCGIVLLALSILLGCPSFAQQDHHDRVFGAYFAEWNVRQTGYNIADVEKSGVAAELDYLIYAFGNVTPGPAPSCAIADPVTAYRDASLPSVNGKPYTAPVYGNFGAILQLKQLHPKLKVLISLGGQLGDPSG